MTTYKEMFARQLAEDIYNAAPDDFDFTLERMQEWPIYDIYEWLEIGYDLEWDDDNNEWAEAE